MVAWRRNTAAVVAILVLAGVLVVVLPRCPCLQPEQPPQDSDGALDGQAEEGFPLLVSVTLDQDQYRVKENIVMNMTLMNVAGENVSFEFGSSCIFAYQVFDANGEKVYDWWMHYGCFDVIVPVTLRPGERISRVWSWNQRMDNGTLVDTGCYTIHVETEGFSYQDKGYILETQKLVEIVGLDPEAK